MCQKNLKFLEWFNSKCMCSLWWSMIILIELLDSVGVDSVLYHILGMGISQDADLRS
jgi:hypothetical protein